MSWFLRVVLGKEVTNDRLERDSPGQIVGMLREAEVHLAKGLKAKGFSRHPGIVKQADYGWRKEYGEFRRTPVYARPLGVRVSGTGLLI